MKRTGIVAWVVFAVLVLTLAVSLWISLDATVLGD